MSEKNPSFNTEELLHAFTHGVLGLTTAYYFYELYVENCYPVLQVSFLIIILNNLVQSVDYLINFVPNKFILEVISYIQVFFSLSAATCQVFMNRNYSQAVCYVWLLTGSISMCLSGIFYDLGLLDKLIYVYMGCNLVGLAYISAQEKNMVGLLVLLPACIVACFSQNIDVANLAILICVVLTPYLVVPKY